VTGPGPIRTVIADDEPPARRTLRLLLGADPEIEVVAESDSGRDALRVLRDARPDLVFLDVQMPGATGLEVMAALRGEPRPRVVFVTAYPEHALDAFGVEAVDYLLKPFDDERFRLALDRAKLAVRERRALDLARRLGALGDVASPPPAAERVAVRDAGGVRLVPVDEIEWIGAQDYYAELHAGPRTYLLRESLQSLAARLDPRRFARIHRGAIVNVARVDTLEPATHGEWTVVLRDGTRLRLSRTHRASLAALAGRSGRAG
jgi:two-component system LytT family response regulator